MALFEFQTIIKKIAFSKKQAILSSAGNYIISEL